jgi:dTDP-4-dehydrorhamnose 3,5-epimerase
MVKEDPLFERLANDPLRFEDGRGWLEVLYEEDDLVLKRSFSKAGVFRGLHWQNPPAGQTKIIRVLEGAIMDVVVDMEDRARAIRTMELTPDSGWVRIPERAAHGFYVRTDTLFEYICHGAYRPDCEVALSIEPWLRERLGEADLILSDKDKAAQPLDDFAG